MVNTSLYAKSKSMKFIVSFDVNKLTEIATTIIETFLCNKLKAFLYVRLEPNCSSSSGILKSPTPAKKAAGSSRENLQTY